MAVTYTTPNGLTTAGGESGVAQRDTLRSTLLKSPSLPTTPARMTGFLSNSGFSQCETLGRSPLVSPSWPRTPGIGISGVVQNDTPGKRLMQSPICGENLGRNDDETERAKARAARVEARKKSIGVTLSSRETPSSQSPPDEDINILSHDALKVMLQNCLKLANANKINQGNTWDLKLIDHLSELVRNDTEDNNSQTNFQLASCTLETGVKIYSYRVDSVHSEAWKLIGGLSRSAHEDVAPDVSGDGGVDGPKSQKSAKSTKKAQSSTLATNESLNVKKFDVAFNVDPLFHQTTSLFDEGGAQGLLLNNLSVYSGCEIVFDSFEIPEITMKAQAANGRDGQETLDLSFMKESIDCMLDSLKDGPEITPTLREIVSLIDDPTRAMFEAEGGLTGPAIHTPDVGAYPRSWSVPPDFDGAEDNDPGEIHDQVDDEFDDGRFSGSTPGSGSVNTEEFDDMVDGSGDFYMSHDPVVDWLAIGKGIEVKSNAWAGPDHWKFARPKEDERSDQKSSKLEKKPRKKLKEPLFLNFEAPEFDCSSDFDVILLKNPRNSLKSNRTLNPGNNLLPQDFHFEARNLAMCFNCNRPHSQMRPRKSKKKPEGPSFPEIFGDGNNGEVPWGDGDNDVDPLGSWDDDGELSDEDELIPEPRKIERIPVKFERHAKLVDVRLLKQTIWDQVQVGSENKIVDEEHGFSFHQMLEHFPDDCCAARPEDISVHLCFMCLLHLANEHTLQIHGCSTMDELKIFLAPGASRNIPSLVEI